MNHLVLITSTTTPKDHGSGFVIRTLRDERGDVAQVVTAAHVVHNLTGTDDLAAHGIAALRVAGRSATLVIDLDRVGVDLTVLEVVGRQAPRRRRRRTEPTRARGTWSLRQVDLRA